MNPERRSAEVEMAVLLVLNSMMEILSLNYVLKAYKDSAIPMKIMKYRCFHIFHVIKLHVMMLQI